MLQASDGAEGLDLIKNEKPDLILLDLSMPSVSGYQVLEELQEAKSDTPVIVISNTDDPEAISRTRALGIKEYVVKAKTNLEQIKDIVKRHIA